MTTQIPASSGGPVGPANITIKHTASSSPARTRNGRRRPAGDRLRSLICPAIGFSTISQAFGANTIKPATIAEIPSVSVKYGSNNSPGTVPKLPVATLPRPYPARTDVGKGWVMLRTLAASGHARGVFSYYGVLELRASLLGTYSPMHRCHSR